jgi:hypothetical protein
MTDTVPPTLIDELVATADRHGQNAVVFNQAGTGELDFTVFPLPDPGAFDPDVAGDDTLLDGLFPNATTREIATSPVADTAAALFTTGQATDMHDALTLAAAIRVVACLDLMDDAGLDTDLADIDTFAAWLLEHLDFEATYVGRLAVQLYDLVDRLNSDEMVGV